jgi:hypothetical protein
MLRQARWLALALIFAALPAWAAAEQLRYRYAPQNACGTMTQVPVGPEGAMGELKRGFGVRTFPYPGVVRPNQIVTFRHPYTGRNATVPMRLPPGTPRMETRPDRIVYNYNDYTVEARFNPDGTVDVVYNSGFLRPLYFD